MVLLDKFCKAGEYNCVHLFKIIMLFVSSSIMLTLFLCCDISTLNLWQGKLCTFNSLNSCVGGLILICWSMRQLFSPWYRLLFFISRDPIKVSLVSLLRAIYRFHDFKSFFSRSSTIVLSQMHQIWRRGSLHFSVSLTQPMPLWPWEQASNIPWKYPLQWMRIWIADCSLFAKKVSTYQMPTPFHEDFSCLES